MSFREWEGPENCPQLPSVIAACQVVSGDMTGLPRVVLATASRAGMIAAGLILAGERDPAKIVKYSVVTTLVVETWVLWWVKAEIDGSG